MISDSPYQSGELVLASRVGIVAGLIGSALMLAPLELASQTTPASRDWLLKLAGVIPGSAIYAPFQLLVTGGVIHAILGAALGLLFAVCLQRMPRYAMIVVGLFYGLVLWVVGGLITRVLFADHLRGVVQSTVYLRACLVYGLVLSGAAALSTGLDRKPIPILPKD